MKTYILILGLYIGFSGFVQGQISSNAPATVSAFGGTYNIQFNIPSGEIWYNSNWSNNGGITFPFHGSQIVTGPTPGYTFTVDKNISCERNLQMVIQNIGTGATYTITITQLSTIPSLSILPTITGPSSVCKGIVNTFKITTTTGSYTTWVVTGASTSTINGFTVVPITYQWYYGNSASSTLSGGSLSALFTSSGTVMVQRNNGCSTPIYDTVNVNLLNPNDTVRISPSIINVPYNLPITFTATGTMTTSTGIYVWYIIKNGSTLMARAAGTGTTFNYNTYTFGDTIINLMTRSSCRSTTYSNKIAISNGPITDIPLEISDTELKVYPNPINDSFQIDNGIVISISDLLGNPVSFTRIGNKYYVEKKGVLFVNTDKGTMKITQ